MHRGARTMDCRLELCMLVLDQAWPNGVESRSRGPEQNSLPCPDVPILPVDIVVIRWRSIAPFPSSEPIHARPSNASSHSHRPSFLVRTHCAQRTIFACFPLDGSSFSQGSKVGDLLIHVVAPCVARGEAHVSHSGLDRVWSWEQVLP